MPRFFLCFYAAVQILTVVPGLCQEVRTGQRTTEMREHSLTAAFKQLKMNVNGPFDAEHLVPQIAAVHNWALKPAEKAEPLGGKASETGQQQGNKSTSHSTTPSADQIDRMLQKLYPNKWERWGRFQQLKIEAQEQSRTILVYQNQNSAATTPIQNPDHVLFKYSVATKGAEFFPTTKDVADQLAVFSKTPKRIGTYNVLCSAGPGINPEKVAGCILKNRKRDFWYRAASGSTGLVSYSDNPQVEQNILITAGSAVSNENRLVSGQVDFDPTNLLLSGTDWKNATTSAAYYDADVRKSFKKIFAKRCHISYDPNGPYGPKDNPDLEILTADKLHCMERLSGPSGWSKFAAVIIPQVEYKVSTQFDYIKSGENFVQPPFPLKHLYYFSFTQDFRKAIASLQARADASAAIDLIKKLNGETPLDMDPDRQAIAEDFARFAVNPSLLQDDKWYSAFTEKLSAALFSQKL